jgi:hypothetical protein
MDEELTEIFTTEQHTNEIVKTLTNVQIDIYLDLGVKILISAQQKLESGEYIEEGITKKQLELDIARIEYNLDIFTEALVIKENMVVITKYPKAMYFHMN